MNHDLTSNSNPMVDHEHLAAHEADSSETESVRSIPLSSGPTSARNSTSLPTTQYPSPTKPNPNFFEVPSYRADTKDSTATPDADTSSSAPLRKDIDVFSDTASVTAPSQKPNVFDTDAESSMTRETSSSSVLTESQTVSRPTSTTRSAYPPPPLQIADDQVSITSTSAKKARPESLLVTNSEGAVIIGIALVDFNHLVRPTVQCRHYRQ